MEFNQPSIVFDNNPEALFMSHFAWVHCFSPCVTIFELGIPPVLGDAAVFANSSGLSSMPLSHHNSSKNLSHDLTLLPLTTIVNTIIVRLWQMYIKAGKNKMWIGHVEKMNPVSMTQSNLFLHQSKIWQHR